MKKKKADAPAAGSPAWMATWSDLVSLLFCFFVMLFASSSIDVARFNLIAASFAGGPITLIEDGGAGITDYLGSGITEIPDVVVVRQDAADRLEDANGNDAGSLAQEQAAILADEFRTYFAENAVGEIEVIQGENFVRLNMEDSILFASGEASLQAESREMLSRVADILEGFPGAYIRIEGHTDSVPIATLRFPNNLHLSSARAIEVMMYFIYERGFDPLRLEPVGFGDTRPVATNTTPEGRAANRRVEFVITTFN